MLAVKATSKPGDWKMASGSAIAFEPPAAKKPMGRRMSPTPVATPIQRRTPARAGSARPRLTRRTQRPSPPSPTVTRGPWTAELMRPMAKGSWRSPTPSSEMTPTASATLLALAARGRQLRGGRDGSERRKADERVVRAPERRPLFRPAGHDLRRFEREEQEQEDRAQRGECPTGEGRHPSVRREPVDGRCRRIRGAAPVVHLGPSLDLSRFTAT